MQYLDDKREASALLSARLTGADLGIADVSRKSLAEWARREELMPRSANDCPRARRVRRRIDDAIYAPYLERLRVELSARQRDRRLAIPPSFDFGQVPGLSNEMRERLDSAGPADLDQAGRVPGITPAALSALHFALIRAAA